MDLDLLDYDLGTLPKATGPKRYKPFCALQTDYGYRISDRGNGEDPAGVYKLRVRVVEKGDMESVEDRISCSCSGHGTKENPVKPPTLSPKAQPNGKDAFDFP